MAEYAVGDIALVTQKDGQQYVGVYTLAPGIDYFWRGVIPGAGGNQLVNPDVSATVFGRETANGLEPPEGSFVVASVPDSDDRTVWERDDDRWYCLCCGGRARWDQLVDPIDTVAPEGYDNGKYGFSPNQ